MDKQTILKNVISFCSNDEEAGNELFLIVQKSINDSLNSLVHCYENKLANEFRQHAHKLRFSLSVIKIGHIQESATYIDNHLTQENFQDLTQQEIMIKFISEIQTLNNVINE